MIGDERITEYIASLEKDSPQVLHQIEKRALEDGVPIIKRPTQNLLRFLMKSKMPSNILEVGAAVGFSALLMCEYMPDHCHITTIEKMSQRIKEAGRNIKLAGKDNKITLIEGDAANILGEMAGRDKGKYDFIFMDAAKGQYIHFLPDIMKLLTEGGTLVSDNVLQDGDVVESRYGVTRRKRTIHQRMRQYLYTITHMEELDTVVLPIGDGVTISCKFKNK